jgi:hypothetical protein
MANIAFPRPLTTSNQNLVMMKVREPVRSDAALQEISVTGSSWALSSPQGEAFALAALLRKGTGSPIPSTSDKAGDFPYEGWMICFLGLSRCRRNAWSYRSQDREASFPASFRYHVVCTLGGVHFTHSPSTSSWISSAVDDPFERKR